MRLKPRKTPTTYVPKRAHRGKGITWKQELDLRRMAGLIKNEQELVSIMLQTKVEMRDACLARVAPYLSFKLRPDFALPVGAEP